uniref:RUN and FYVE domain containing 3 n=1 Tax=Cercocebus atys TaxID=9531 RepID=A0A2K5L1J5_CERAT
MAETPPPPTAGAESCSEEPARGGEWRPEELRRAPAGGTDREGEVGPPPASPAGQSEPDSPVAAPFFLLYPGDGGAGFGVRPPPQQQRSWRTPPSPGSPLPFLLLSYPSGSGGGGSGKHHPNYLMANERMNLMNMAKFFFFFFIESRIFFFFFLLKYCFIFVALANFFFFFLNKSFWGPLELVEKLVPEAAEITAIGRVFFFFFLALMQKKLSEYMNFFFFFLELLSEFYEPNALMMEEEGAIIAGLLVGLNVIDANFCMKGEDLDSQVGVIDFSMYLKDGNSSKGTEGDGQITAILDQKNYCYCKQPSGKVDALENQNKLTEEIITLQEEMERVKEESSYILESNRKGPKQDRTAEGQALSEARKHLKEETQLRLDVEKELEMQISMRQEMELAMKMLEKDVCEKQDALVSLRQQLDDLRALKHELAFKLQSSDLGVKQKSELNSRLEEKTNQMAATIKQLEQR